MSSIVRPASEDFVECMDLLKEYTGKLREFCEAKSQGAFRLFIIQVVFIALALLFSFLFILVATVVPHRLEDSQDSLFLYISTGMAACAFYLFVSRILPTYRRFRFSFDPDQVAASLIEVVKLSSQYSEHASKRIGNKFEFDLRLAEAEAALQQYYAVFSKKPLIHRDQLSEKPEAAKPTHSSPVTGVGR